MLPEYHLRKGPVDIPPYEEPAVKRAAHDHPASI